MAETLVELVAKIKADATDLEKGLSDAEKKTESASKNMAESLKKIGIAMTASGAAITATMGLLGKAAIDEEINIKRLANTINNSGTAYDNVKDSLEAVISATQRKTGIADNEQRDILTRLILVTNDYGKAMELLPTVLDLAAAGQMDATTAATYLGKAYLELEEGAESVSVRFGQASLQFKNMEDIQNRVAGSAENLVNPFAVLSASVGDLGEVLGTFLIPTVKTAIDQFVDVAIKIQEWTNEHPVLANVLVSATAILGGLLLVVGSAILIIPKLVESWVAFHTIVNLTTIKLVANNIAQVSSKAVTLASAAAIGVVTAAQWAWNVAMTANPIGIVIVAIAALIAAIILIARNWDMIKAKTIAVWDAIGKFLNGIFIGIKTGWDNVVKFIVSGVNWLIDKINGLIQLINMIPFMNIGSIPNVGTPPPEIPGFASGGVVPGPVGAPQLATVHGGETIIPINESGAQGVTVNFTQPVFFDREDQMNKFVDMIRKGIQRQDRLRFGGAYSGS